MSPSSMKGVTLMFFIHLVTSAVLGGIAAAILYIPFIIRNPVELGVTHGTVTATFIGGALVAAASVFAKIAADTFTAGLHRQP
jgi:hypothetical protein